VLAGELAEGVAGQIQEAAELEEVAQRQVVVEGGSDLQSGLVRA
jgi:hypothetical protein